MTFGKYPNVSLADARIRHAEARGLKSKGIDRMAVRKEPKALISPPDGPYQNVLLERGQGNNGSFSTADLNRRRIFAGYRRV